MKFTVNRISHGVVELGSVIFTIASIGYLIYLLIIGISNLDTLVPSQYQLYGTIAAILLPFITLVVIVWVGTTNSVANRIIISIGKQLETIPYIEIIFNTLRSVLAFTFGTAIDEHYTVVLIKNTTFKSDMIGLVTRVNNEDIYPGENRVAVYIPTSYNVGTGVVLMVNRDELIFRPDLSPQQVFRFVTVGGFGMDSVSLKKQINQSD